MPNQAEIARITSRVAELIRQGCSTRQIAERLGIGIRRVERARERSQHKKQQA